MLSSDLSDALIIFVEVYTLIKQVMSWNTKLNQEILFTENSYVIIIGHFKDNQSLRYWMRWSRSVLHQITTCTSLHFKNVLTPNLNFVDCLWVIFIQIIPSSVINRVIIYDFTIYTVCAWKFKPVFHCFSDILPLKFHIGALKNLVQSDKIQ